MVNKKRIGMIILCAVIVLSICASGCIEKSTVTTTKNKNPSILMDYESWNGYGAEIAVFIDPVTGINYIILREGGGRAGICPRYDVDGNLYISEMA